MVKRVPVVDTGSRRSLRGSVVSVAGEQTAIIRTEGVREHPLYRKKFKVSRRLAAHDPGNRARVGQVVVITETRPISRTKRFILSEVVSEPSAAEAREEEGR